jgi:hypothetical protein
MKLHHCSLATILAFLITSAVGSAAISAERWTREQANEWYGTQPWLVGCNFLPSTAINQLEMWQAETFDPETIDRELGWAESIGFQHRARIPARAALAGRPRGIS